MFPRPALKTERKVQEASTKKRDNKKVIVFFWDERNTRKGKE